MRFFERQQDVRRNTVRLGLLFAVAVAGVVWALNRIPYLGLMWLGFRPWNPPAVPGLPFETPTWTRVLWSFHPWITAVVLAVIGAGALWTWLRVRRGGPAVAERVGGRPLAPDTRDPAEVRLQHVVEEMAIASGLPAPAVYVLDGQPAINAFAAGRSTEDGAIAVTSGALETLDRDELQAVVAHEMSHLLNGDARINLRAMCLVGGLTGVKTVGAVLCEDAWKSLRKSGQSALLTSVASAVLGLALQAVGAVGVLAGRLLKAALSRQREFLADASAVQFTRNPAALSGALRKMAARPGAVSVSGAHAGEVSHMFFAQDVRASAVTLFDTHPTIAERLAAIEGGAATAAPAANAPRAAAPRIDYARRLHGRIPEPILQYARTPSAARGVVGGVLLHDAAAREAQVEILSSIRAPDVVEAAMATAECVRAEPEALRLPLVELAMPALARLSRPDQNAFVGVLRALVDVDRRRTVFEFAVVALVEWSLHGSPPETDRVRFRSLAEVRAEVADVLWLLARAGSRDGAQAQAAWRAGVSRLGGRSVPLATNTGALPPLDVDERVRQALATLRTLAPAAKRELLEALAACARADDAITVGETEVLRAVSAAIGAPLPPLVPAHRTEGRVSEVRA
jgi:Zn-dependent protease with chaperone function